MYLPRLGEQRLVLQRGMVSPVRTLVSLLLSGLLHLVHDEDHALWRWQRGLRFATILVGAVAAWRSRYAMNSDGVAYLDLGDALLRGEWNLALNSYWSPLYPAVLVVFRALSGFDPTWEPQLVHLANFFLFLVALSAFELLLVKLLRTMPPIASDRGEGVASSRSLLVLLGYPLFLWSTVQLIGLHFVTPDLCVAAAAFFGVAMIVELRSGEATPRQGLIFGLGLGLGYLSKAAMLFIGVGFLLVAWRASGLRRGFRSIAMAAVVYTLIGGTFIALLSWDQGRFTYGDSGRLNYSWHVLGVKAFAYPRTNLGRHGKLIHPPRIVHRNPRIFEFAEPMRTTYPLWYDAPYWYEGLTVSFDVDRQVRRLDRTLQAFNRMAFQQTIVVALLLTALLFALFSTRRPRWRALVGMARPYHLLLAGLGPIAMYSLVNVMPRYIAPFVAILFLGLLAGLRVIMSRQAELQRSAFTVAIVITSFIAINVFSEQKNCPDDEQLRIAEALHEQGLEEGAPIGVVGDSFKAHWARLGRFRIIADIPRREGRRFWTISPARRDRALEAFHEAGAKAVISTRRRPPGRPWKRLADSSRYVYFFTDSDR